MAEVDVQVYLIGPYVIQIKDKKENLHIKDVTMIDTVIGYFEVLRYEDKRAITIANLVKLRGCLDILKQQKLRITKENNLLVTSSENP